MKEKIDNFFDKGYHFLAMILLSCVLIVQATIKGISIGSVAYAFSNFLLEIPWLLLFYEMYDNRKTLRLLDDQFEEKDKRIEFLYHIVERYRKLYGDLPPEEETKEEKKEEQA